MHPNFWWGILWCIGLLLFTQIPGAVVSLITIAVAMILTPSLLSTRDLQSSDSLLANPVVQFAMGAGILSAHALIILISLLLLRVVVGRDWTRQVALRTPNLSHVLLIFALVPAFMVLANGAYYVLRHVLHFPSVFKLMGGGGMEEMEKSFGSWPLVIGVLVIGLLPGISEELWCRAYLGRGIVGKHGYVLGVLGTSFLFGLIHIDPCQGGMAAVLGVVLHYVYLTSRSLFIPMLLHFLNNGMAVVLTRFPQVAALAPAEAPSHWLLYLNAGFLLFAVCFAFYQSRARLVTPEGAEGWTPPWAGVGCPSADSATVVQTPTPSVASIVLVVVALVAFVNAAVYILVTNVQ